MTRCVRASTADALLERVCAPSPAPASYHHPPEEPPAERAGVGHAPARGAAARRAPGPGPMPRR